jgi:hypothetical protein
MSLKCRVCSEEQAEVHESTFNKGQGQTLFLACRDCGVYAVEEPTEAETLAVNVASTNDTLEWMRDRKAARLRRNRYLQSEWGVPYSGFRENKVAIDLENKVEEGALMFLEDPEGFTGDGLSFQFWAGLMQESIEQYNIVSDAQVHLVQALSFVTKTDLDAERLFSDLIEHDEAKFEQTPEKETAVEDQIASLLTELLGEFTTTDNEES